MLLLLSNGKYIRDLGETAGRGLHLLWAIPSAIVISYSIWGLAQWGLCNLPWGQLVARLRDVRRSHRTCFARDTPCHLWRVVRGSSFCSLDRKPEATTAGRARRCLHPDRRHSCVRSLSGISLAISSIQTTSAFRGHGFLLRSPRPATFRGAHRSWGRTPNPQRGSLPRYRSKPVFKRLLAPGCAPRAASACSDAVRVSLRGARVARRGPRR